MPKAIYPGTFDPLTLGHLDIVRKACQIFNYLVIAIAEDSTKSSLFNTEERIAIIKNDIKEKLPEFSDKIVIKSFKGLLINFAKQEGINILVRGLRAVSDFEFEFQLASMNERLDSNIQTIFLPASENKHFISSSMIKEISRLGGDVSRFVTPNTLNLLGEKYSSKL